MSDLTPDERAAKVAAYRRSYRERNKAAIAAKARSYYERNRAEINLKRKFRAAGVAYPEAGS